MPFNRDETDATLTQLREWSTRLEETTAELRAATLVEAERTDDGKAH